VTDAGDLQELISRLPPGTVSSHPGEVAAHAHDRWALALLREARGDRVAPPAAVVFATTTEQVAIALAWAQETGTLVVSRGGGTGLAGGAEAIKHSVVIDTSHMDRILGIDDVSQTVQAEAGVRMAALERALQPRGLTTGLDPERPEAATVGGLVAGEPAAAFWPVSGSPRDRLLGVTAVLPGGGILRAKPVPVASQALDVRGLVVGSEGILGVITEATLGLVRLPREMAWETFRPHAFDAALTLVREIVQRSYGPRIVSLLDEAAASSMFGSLGRPAPVLIVGFDAAAPAVDAVRFELQRLAKTLGAHQAEREMAVHWWEHRLDEGAWYDDVMGADRAMGAGVVADRLGVAALWRHLPRVYEEVRGILLDDAEGVRCKLVGASSPGATLEFAFVVRGSDDRVAGQRYIELWERASGACLDAGGALAGERGLRGVRLVPDELGPTAFGVARRLRAAFDPDGLMNQGKLL
jgi:alkyldihydroxyacetonephosphate synthase